MADVELMLCTYIKAKRGVRCVTDLPADMTSLPIVQVVRFAGADEVMTLDQAAVDIDVFHTDRAAAHALADLIRRDIRFDLPGYMLGGAVVANTETISGPKWLPYDNTNLRRNQSSYRVTVHSTL